MSTIPGLHVIGEANFGDHGANRLGASALMQGLADGYFILPYTLGHYLAGAELGDVATSGDELASAVHEAEERTAKLLALCGPRTVDSIHKELGQVLWDDVGMARSEASLARAAGEIARLRGVFWSEARVLPARGDELNMELEKAGRVADFIELAELLVLDARARRESCGGHFRVEHVTADGEAARDDENFAHVAVWEHQGEGRAPLRNVEPLVFEEVALATRSYK